MERSVITDYADLLLDYCVRLEPGDRLTLEVDQPATELARALVRGALAREAVPRLHLRYPEWHEDVATGATQRYLRSEADVELFEMERSDAYVRVAAPTNSRGLTGADPSVLSRLEARSRAVREQRVRHTRWVTTLFPTASGAQDADMSLTDYRRFVFGAMHLFDADPAAAWQALSERQARLIERLTPVQELRIHGADTDLRLTVAGRTWVNSAGRRNMPSGEVFTSPLEDSAEGTILFDVPSFVAGRRVSGVRLEFRSGEVVDASASEGEALLHERLARDPGARRLGELGIGTNDAIDRATGSTLFDEKIGGTVHLALGSSYLEAGGRNESGIHWDLIKDLRQGGGLEADGVPLDVRAS